MPFSTDNTQPDSVLRVDAGESTGAVHGGATGMLYGLGEPGVPADSLLEGARPRTVSQKAPGGAQHPTGDALLTSGGFFAAGGSEMHVYLQDSYEQWPYEQHGIDDYCARVDAIVKGVAASPDAAKFVWVPFNEPDWIWYGNWGADRERFFADWAAVHRTIRAILPAARIVGPNDMVYNHERLADFLEWAASADLLPDLVSWHELQPDGLSNYRAHRADYLGILGRLGIPPIPVIINEYGNRRDFANPAQVVQWVSMFEETKVDANMAFWTAAGNLDDHVAGVQQANGGWWLLNWYADLVGETVRVDAPRPSTIDSLQGIAAFHRGRRQLDVLFGGGAHAPSVELVNLPSDIFGAAVDLVVMRTTWSGHEGDAMAPVAILRSRRLLDGPITVVVPELDPMAAYRLIVTPMEAGSSRAVPPWSARLEAESAELTDAVVELRDTDPQEYATSGGRDVSGLASADSRIDFDVALPSAGAYRLGTFYGTDGARGRLALFIDEVFVSELDLPATLTRAHRGRHDQDVSLTAGSHRISLRTSGPNGILDGSDVSVDRLDVTQVRQEDARRLYPARLFRLAGASTLQPGDASSPASVQLDGGSGIIFAASSAAGYHEISVHLAPGSDASQMGIVVEQRKVAATLARANVLRALVHLAHGVSVIRVTGSGAAFTAIEVAPESGSDVEGTLAIAAADGCITVPRPPGTSEGSYNLVLWYTHGSRGSGHEYNTDVESARIEVGEAGAPPLQRSLPFTGVANVWQLVVPIDLITARGGITVKPTAGAPRVHRVALVPLAR